MVVALLIASWATSALAENDPDDVKGRLDLRRVVALKEFPGGHLRVTITTWLPWMDRALRRSTNNRIELLLDTDGVASADFRARVVRSHGALTVEISSSGNVSDVVRVFRPNRRAASFTVPAGSVANPFGELSVAASSRYRGVDVCSLVCRDRVPDSGWVDVTMKGGDFACTQVIGFSQTRQWFLDAPDFEAAVGTDRWQLLWNSGGAIDLWADPGYAGWDEPIQSPCADGAAAPDRVVLTISGQFEADPDRWADDITAAIATVRSKFPQVSEIVLQPVVGGPNDGTCGIGNGVVRASFNHPVIDEAIAQIVGGTVLAGASPEVSDCADYADDKGHLVSAARGPIGASIGAFYGSD